MSRAHASFCPAPMLQHECRSLTQRTPEPTRPLHDSTRHDKSHSPARWGSLKALVDGLTVPIIANGDLYTRQHVEELRASVGDPGLAVMLARPALHNPSVFRTLNERGGGSHELAPLDEAMREYLRLCLRFENHVTNTKTTLMEMMSRKRHPDHLKVGGWVYELRTTDRARSGRRCHACMQNTGRPPPGAARRQDHPRRQPPQDHRRRRRSLGA